MREISVYKGTDEYANRNAIVYLNEEGAYIVRICKDICMDNHNLMYAEDAAENFVLGIMDGN